VILLVTVDVEGMPLKDGTWDYSTIIEGIPLIRDMFKEFGISGTFFVSSDVAQNVGEAMKEVISSRHEIGCHGYKHRALDFCDIRQQYLELREATETIEAGLNIKPVGFRAPFCRIGESIMPILTKLGYEYDSSVVPSPKLYSRYYYPNAPTELYRPSLASLDKKGEARITEMPISILPVIGLPMGLSYCLLFGLSLYKSFLQDFDQEVMTLYLHNYDFYPIPSGAKVSPFFRLPYLRREEHRIRFFRDLLEFLTERFSPTFLTAGQMLERFKQRGYEPSSKRSLKNHPEKVWV